MAVISTVKRDMMTTAIDNRVLFNSTQRAAMTQEMTLKVQVSESCFVALKTALPDPQQQVELVGVIAVFNWMASFLEALHVAPE